MIIVALMTWKYFGFFSVVEGKKCVGTVFLKLMIEGGVRIFETGIERGVRVLLKSIERTI